MARLLGIALPSVLSYPPRYDTMKGNHNVIILEAKEAEGGMGREDGELEEQRMQTLSSDVVHHRRLNLMIHPQSGDDSRHGM